MAMFRNTAAALFLLSGLASVSNAQNTSAQPVQTLDRVITFSTAGAIEMGFGDALRRNPDFTKFTALSATGFTSCQLTAISGLVCLDGRLIRNWTDPKNDPTAVTTLFSCADERLGLDTRKPDTCTAMTVDTAGNIWIAGKKNSAHSLIKVVRKTPNGACPAPFVESDALKGVKGDTAELPSYCAKEYASGRPLLQDISAIDGDVGAAFNYGPGVLGLEERKTLVFFRDTAGLQPIVIASGKAGWGLQGSELVHGSTLLQRTVDTLAGTVTDNFALVTTSTGRILQKEIKDLVGSTNTPAASSAFQTTLQVGSTSVASIPLARTRPAACAFAAFYELRASTKSGVLYATDRAACQIVAFKPAYPYDPSEVGLPPSTSTANVVLTADLTLLTASTSPTSASYPPEGVTITPGIDIPLANCQGDTGCVMIPDNNQDLDPNQTIAGARLTNVQYVGTKDSMVLFQVQNIPDCRAFTNVNLGPAHPTAPDVPPACLQFATTDQVIISASNGRYLNVAPLLPPELTTLLVPYGENGKLPEMLISPEHVATPARDSTFDAIVGFTDKDLVFRDTFTAVFDIQQLYGAQQLSNCGFEDSDPNSTNLNWDLLTAVSERWPTVGGPAGNNAEKVDMLANTFCENPTSGSGTRWSMYTYGLQPRNDGQDTYKEWVERLYFDLDETRYRFGCHANSSTTYNNAKITAEAPTAPNNVPPLSAASCSALAGDWADGYIKLNKCLLASTDPKSSAGAENCQAFRIAFGRYESTLAAATYSSVPNDFVRDPANRLGELKSRVKVLWHVFENHFIPSIPVGGFPATP